jgi:anthranilate synthase component 2
MKTVIIDNYDSFTYNLVHYIEEINDERPIVLRNDKFELNDLEKFDIIVLSPGPGLPKDAGLLMDVIEKYHKTKVILGVCLGHQALGEFFGSKLKNLSQVYHGVDCELDKLSDVVIYGDSDTVTVGRYHSWVVDPVNFSSELEITSIDNDGEIMSLKHKTLPIHGVQYHPESVLTPEGKQLLRNFFNHYKQK